MPIPFATVLFDIDGTLIDSNGAHATAWLQALREHHYEVDADLVRRLIGVGSDKFLPLVAGIDADSSEGRTLSQRKKEIFSEHLPGLLPTSGARALVTYLTRAGVELVVATSAGEDEVEGLLTQAGVADLLPVRASKDDAQRSKPDPDIVQAAMVYGGRGRGPR